MLKDLVVIFGYNGNKELVKYVFSDFDFLDKISFHNLIFSYNPENNKYEIRKGIIDDIENIIYGGKTEDFSYAKEGIGYNNISEIITKIEDQKSDYINPDETIAYLYNKELQVGIVGDIQQKLENLPDYKMFLKRNNFYQFERLKQYVEIIYEPSFDENPQSKSFYIEDPDGYTNLRREKSSSSEILQKIKSGENIEVLNNTGDWWQVKTKEGKIGYVHKSRIKSGNIGHSASYRLYDRPDYSSFSKEIFAKGEIEYLNKVSSWDFVNIDGVVGYLPTIEVKKEIKDKDKLAENKKHSFLAEEDDMKNSKKKGFWDNLLG